MEVLSNFVLVENPFVEKDEKKTIILEGSAKEDLIRTKLEKAKSIEVYKSGISCTKVKEGDKVYVDTDRLMSAARVTIEDKHCFIIRETDIIFIY